MAYQVTTVRAHLSSQPAGLRPLKQELARPATLSSNFAAQPQLRSVRQELVLRAAAHDDGSHSGNMVTTAMQYLAEAMAALFSSTRSNVEWERTTLAYSGEVHHKHLRGDAKYGAARQALEKANEDLMMNTQEMPSSPKDYLVTAFKRVLNNNFTGDASEPNWQGTQYSFSGTPVRNQRNARRKLWPRRSSH